MLMILRLPPRAIETIYEKEIKKNEESEKTENG